MLTKENISKAAKEKITDIGGFLVDVKMNTNNNITIHFDNYEGVLIEDCISVTKHLESIFDRDIEDYELSVCSAGLTQPFKVSEQYLKNIGKEVSIKLKDGKRKSGVIKFFDENLTLETIKKKKNQKRSILLKK
jgi:ribosome maturation factor RimP